MSIFDSLFGGNTTTQTGQTNLQGSAQQVGSQLMDRTLSYANQPYQSYGGERLAGFTPDQEQGFQYGRDIAQRAGGLFGGLQNRMDRDYAQSQDPMMRGYNQDINDYSVMTRANLPISQQYAARGNQLAGQGLSLIGSSVPATMSLAQRFPDAPISDYMNPYLDEVLAPAQQDLERTAAQRRNELSANAVRTGSFGGSRNAVGLGELDRNLMQESGRLSANTRSAAFDNAANQFRQDQTMIPQLYSSALGQLGAATGLQQAGQGMNTAVIEDNARAIQQNLAGQQGITNLANLEGTRYNQGLALLGANQGLIQSQVSPLMASGNTQQAFNQAGNDVNYSNWTQQRDWDTRGLDMLTRSLGLAPSTMASTTQTTEAPGANRIGQVAGTGLGLLSLLGGEKGATGGLARIGTWLGY